MIIKNKSIRKILFKVIIAFILVAVAEYLTIILLSSMPIVMFKVQAVIAVSIIAFLVHSAYKIWRLCNLDHPLSENGEHK